MAEGADSVPGIEVRIRGVEDATQEDLLWCDGLAPGTYQMNGTGDDRVTHAEPQTVTVPASGFTQVELDFDNGVR